MEGGVFFFHFIFFFFSFPKGPPVTAHPPMHGVLFCYCTLLDQPFDLVRTPPSQKRSRGRGTIRRKSHVFPTLSNYIDRWAKSR